MSRNRFETLTRYIQYSDQPEEIPEGMTSEAHRWKMVDDFVDAFNKHMANNFTPGHCICVDESFSRWYGLGGHWINFGLPHYVAFERKPEHGCEIHAAACALCGIIFAIAISKSANQRRHDRIAARERARQGPPQDKEEAEDVSEGACVMLKLLRPWYDTWRVVCADSWFASVSSAIDLFKVGLLFLGMVKTGHREYPKFYFNDVTLDLDKGDRIGLHSEFLDKDGVTLLACLYADKDRRHLSSIEEAVQPIKRRRLRQVDNVSTNLPPVSIDISINQPECAWDYYDGNAKVDKLNCDRQDTFDLEKKIETKKWDSRANMSIILWSILGNYISHLFNRTNRMVLRRTSTKILL